MKKWVSLFAALLLTAGLCGCQNGDDSLRQQISDLQQQLSSLMQAGAASGDTTSTDSAGAPSSSSASETTASQGAASAQATDRAISDLTKQVEAFEKSAQTASAAQGADLEAYFKLRQQCDEIERSLDVQEDVFEQQYRAGSLSRDDYRALERKLDALEDRLDNAEDRLERAFGIYDD